VGKFTGPAIKVTFAPAAAAAGAKVTLIAGPVNLPTPEGVERIDVESAEQMLAEVQAAVPQSSIFIGCAAVADFKAAHIAENKMKKTQGEDEMVLTLVKNPDILAWVAHQSPRPFTVGFAAETQQVEAYAVKKMRQKQLDMIVANDVSVSGLGFNSDQNAAHVYWPTSPEAFGQQAFAARSKLQLAKDLIQLISEQKK